MDAFDADALIYAAVRDHPMGRRVRSLIDPGVAPTPAAGVGSVLLVPEVLIKPIREGWQGQLELLQGLLRRLELCPVDSIIANLAATLGAAYRLKAPDATHLATAVNAGADRFITNNRRDFRKTITEIDITYPDELDDFG